MRRRGMGRAGSFPGVAWPVEIRLAELPPAAEWRRASPQQRSLWFRILGEQGQAWFRARFAAGRGADDTPLRPRTRPRRDGASGPVLAPHGLGSRFTERLSFRVGADHATLFWRPDSDGTHMGIVAACQKRGVRSRAGRIVRDVTEISPKGREEIRRDTLRRWRAERGPLASAPGANPAVRAPGARMAELRAGLRRLGAAARFAKGTIEGR